MKNITSSLALLAGLTAVAVSTSSAFSGSDDFSAGLTSKWAFSYRLNDINQGALPISDGRVNVTQAAAGAGNWFRVWDGNLTNSATTSDGARTSLSFTTSWTMEVSATNQLTGLSSGEFLSVGIQARSGNDYFATFLLAGPAGTVVSNQLPGGPSTQVTAPATSTENVRLRISWDASAQVLATSYSFDSGTTYNNLVADYAVSSWTANPPSNGFNFETFMNANLGTSLASGTAYMDNFSISAIPEPSAFAVLAGLATLGLATSRRRRRA